MAEFQVNDAVKTENGEGTIQGRMFENGETLMLIRILGKKQVSDKAGFCVTPLGTHSKLYAIPVDQVQRA